MFEHIPVLLDETVQALEPQDCSAIVDGTFGRGGHAHVILSKLPKNAQYFAFDKDPQALESAQALAEKDPRVIPIHASYACMSDELKKRGVDQVDAVLMDLGVSSCQLDDAARGFSFARSGPLDMRMNPEQSLSAASWIKTAPEKQIADVLFTLGQERRSRPIARKIVAARQEAPITTTKALAEIIRSVVPSMPGKDGATRSFQAIRMHINQEMEDLEAGLESAFRIIKPQGRLCVITFHSLEDGPVKRFYQSKCQANVPKGLPLREHEIIREGRLLGKPIRPGKNELQQNPRSRSATLRVLEKR